MAEYSIVFRDVWKIYRGNGIDYPALRGVNFVVEKGELVALQGPSGSGKTTVIYLAGGLDTPTRGEVIVNSENLSRLSEGKRAKWRRRNVGIVFQFFHLVPTLTVLENVILPMELAEYPPKEKRLERAEELLEIIGMKNKREKFPNQLSGGEQQRVAIARALAADPYIILADEPTANLDTRNKLKIIDLLIEANHLGKTILYTTHDPQLASKADRVLKIEDGRIVPLNLSGL